MAHVDYQHPQPESLVPDRGSARRLDDVGAFAVLGAMRDQRHRAGAGSAEDSQQVYALDDRDLEFDDIPRAQRVSADSDAFLKAR